MPCECFFIFISKPKGIDAAVVEVEAGAENGSTTVAVEVLIIGVLIVVINLEVQHIAIVAAHREVS